ncbi:hypothetical protein [Lysinibacillus xylanilyticus]|uniref:hypothetical protein n=1 Tax=Lysinibacillus xylanilyticus TaxID=582475 RepID=UPI0038145DC0
MDDINEYVDYKFQHTYLVYKKIRSEPNNPISKVLLNSSDINVELQRIYQQNFEKSTLINSYRYGLFGTTKNGDYLIRRIEYQGYNLYFVVSPLTIIFINYVEVSVIVPNNEFICLPEVDIKIYKDFIKQYKFDGFNFTFINTYEPFYDFCNDYFSGELTIKNNSIFWIDFFSYLEWKPVKGQYDVIQLDELVIITDYKRVNSKKSFDVYNHGIQNPKSL